jgi:hypothetical protein
MIAILYRLSDLTEKTRAVGEPPHIITATKSQYGPTQQEKGYAQWKLADILRHISLDMKSREQRRLETK